MVPGYSGKRIVRSYTEWDAPTGEGDRWVDENGTVWAPLPAGSGDAATGERRGQKHRDTIYED